MLQVFFHNKKKKYDGKCDRERKSEWRQLNEWERCFSTIVFCLIENVKDENIKLVCTINGVFEVRETLK